MYLYLFIFFLYLGYFLIIGLCLDINNLDLLYSNLEHIEPFHIYSFILLIYSVIIMVVGFYIDSKKMSKIMYNFFDRNINLGFYFCLIYIIFQPDLQLAFAELNTIFHFLIKYKSWLLVILIIFFYN